MVESDQFFLREVVTCLFGCGRFMRYCGTPLLSVGVDFFSEVG